MNSRRTLLCCIKQVRHHHEGLRRIRKIRKGGSAYVVETGKGSNGASNHNTRTKEGGEGERGTKRNWTSWNGSKALRQESTFLLNKERQEQFSSTFIQTSLSPERVRFWRKQLSDHHRVQFKIMKDGAKEAPNKSRRLATSKTDKVRVRGQLSN